MNKKRRGKERRREERKRMVGDVVTNLGSGEGEDSGAPGWGQRAPGIARLRDWKARALEWGRRHRGTRTGTAASGLQDRDGGV